MKHKILIVHLMFQERFEELKKKYVFVLFCNSNFNSVFFVFISTAIFLSTNSNIVMDLQKFDFLR